MVQPTQTICLLCQTVLLVFNVYFQWKFIKVAVIRDYFMTFARSLLAIISGGYTCTVFVNFAIVFSSVFVWESVKIGFENINATLEFIMNFAKLLFFLDNYFGNYKKLFNNRPLVSFCFVNFCILAFFFALVIPEFTQRGYGRFPRSHLFSFGFTVLNVLLNTVVFYLKRKDIVETRGKVDLNDRFQTSEARESSSTMLCVTVIRFFVSGAWVTFQCLSSGMSEDALRNAQLVVEIFRSVEALAFPIVFTLHNASIVRHRDRQELIEKNNGSLPKDVTEEERRRFPIPTMSAEEKMTKQSKEWDKAYYRTPKGKKQKAESDSRQKLLRTSSFELDIRG